MKTNKNPLQHTALLTLACLLSAAVICAANPTATLAQNSGTETKQPAHTEEQADIRKIRIGVYGDTDRITFDFYKSWISDTPLQKPPAFRIAYKTHPQRLILTAKAWTSTATTKVPINHRIINAIYSVPSQSKEEQTLVIELKAPATFQTLTLEQPARLAIDITRKRKEQDGKNMYSLRTQSYEKTTYNLEETLLQAITAISTATGRQAQVIGSGNHTLFIEAGLYESAPDTERDREKLFRLPYLLLTEERSPSSEAQAIFPAPAPPFNTYAADWVRIDMPHPGTGPFPNILIDFATYKQVKDAISINACLVMPDNTRAEFTASINCQKRIFDITASKSYDSHGQPLGSESEQQRKWMPITAGSQIDHISIYTCIGNKNRKPADFAKMRAFRDHTSATSQQEQPTTNEYKEAK